MLAKYSKNAFLLLLFTGVSYAGWKMMEETHKSSVPQIQTLDDLHNYQLKTMHEERDSLNRAYRIEREELWELYKDSVKSRR